MRSFANFMLIVTLFLSGCQRKDYLSGKDTLESFGNGRFQLLRGGRLQRTLMDVKEQDTLLSNTATLREDGNRIYAYGDKGKYVIIDLQAEAYSKYDTIGDVPQEYREKAAALRIVK